MNPKPVIFASICAVLFVVVAYFGGQRMFEQGRIEEATPPVESVKKPSTVVVEPEVEVIDSTSPPQTEPERAVKAEPAVPVTNAVDTVQTVDAGDDGLVERFLPDGTLVPKHLRLPKKWVGIGTSEVSSMPEEVYEEIHNWLHGVAREVVANYNPNRPIAEVWPRFMTAEKQYLMQSPDADKPYSLGFGAGQVDFVYNQIWDFPEVFALSQSEGFDSLHTRVHMVELGVREPDWNYVELPDGRDFYVKHGYEYTFNYSGDPDADPNDFGGGGFTISFSPNPTKVTIDLDTATDEDLERLGGWNYNFNPYTNQPIGSRFGAKQESESLEYEDVNSDGEYEYYTVGSLSALKYYTYEPGGLHTSKLSSYAGSSISLYTSNIPSYPFSMRATVKIRGTGDTAKRNPS